VHWETAGGAPMELPIHLGTPGVVVDDAGIRGGEINGSQSVGWDLNGKLVITYIKYDANGITQLYFARWQGGAWKSVQASHWDYRWDFHGGGSIPMEIMPGPLKAADGKLSIEIHHVKYGDAVWQVDPATMQLTGQPVPVINASRDELAEQYMPAAGSPFQANFAHDLGTSEATGATYRLMWTTLGANRDQPRAEGAPPPTMLRLLISK
jgi:hypothetical protein